MGILRVGHDQLLEETDGSVHRLLLGHILQCKVDEVDFAELILERLLGDALALQYVDQALQGEVFRLLRDLGI